MPLTFAFSVVCLCALPTPGMAQATGGRPSVEVDNSVLDQLGPPVNLPAMLLQATPTPIQRPIILIPPKSFHASGKSAKPVEKVASARAPHNAEPAAIHLHPVKPHAIREANHAAEVTSAVEKPAAAEPKRPVTPAKAAEASPTVESKAPVSLTPTLSQSPPTVTSESLKAPPARDKAPVTAPLPSTVISPPTAAPAPSPAAAPPQAAGAGQPLVALTAQPATSETPSSAASQQESLSTVSFDKDSARLPDGSRDMLAHLASRMSEDATLEVQLLAYAAGDEANASKARRLSLSRALAVRSFLIDQGVRNTRIEVRALGNKVPDGPPDRVDIVMQKRG